MVGLLVESRWRFPLTALIFIGLLGGCSLRQEMADGSEAVLPQVKMALVKIPLNGKPDDNVFDNLHPAEIISVSSSHGVRRPSW